MRRNPETKNKKEETFINFEILKKNKNLRKEISEKFNLNEEGLNQIIEKIDKFRKKNFKRYRIK